MFTWAREGVLDGWSVGSLSCEGGLWRCRVLTNIWSRGLLDILCFFWFSSRGIVHREEHIGSLDLDRVGLGGFLWVRFWRDRASLVGLSSG